VWDGKLSNHTFQLTVQARRLSLFGHIARMSDESDAKQILTASPLENWRIPPGRPHTTWMKTTQQDLKSMNLSLNEAIDVAQNHPLSRRCLRLYVWRYALKWCMPEMNEWMNVRRTYTLIKDGQPFY